MPVCENCNTTFGDLEYRIGPEQVNSFDEVVTSHKCPKCGKTVGYNRSTEESWLEEEDYGE